MVQSEDELPREEELPEEEEASEGDGDEEDEDEDESEDEDEDESEEDDSDGSPRPRKRHKKAELPPPGREMPQRATRGQRMGALVKDAENEQADEEFWNQEFFAEEAADEVYETESEPEDVADADFSDSEGSEEDEEEAEAEVRAREPKKKVLKPPGYKKPPLPPKPKPPGGTPAEKAPRKRQPSLDAADFVVQRRTVRDSTRQKVLEGEEERKLQEMLKPRRVMRSTRSVQPLTQAELLAEAAKTEIENTKSLQYLQFLEEQTKKKAEVKKKKYAGPMLRFLSRGVEGQEKSTLEVRNMQTPAELLPKVAPEPPPKPVCAVTGLPAKYRDPRTGLPYANLEAYRALQQRAAFGGGLLPPQLLAQQQQLQQQAGGFLAPHPPGYLPPQQWPQQAGAGLAAGVQQQWQPNPAVGQPPLYAA